MIYHIVTGDMAAAPVNAAMEQEPSMAGKVVVIRDLFNIGPLQKTEEGQKFSELRSAFWQEVVYNEKNPINVNDTENISEVSVGLLNNEEAKAWIWMAPWGPDICTYLWTLKYLGQYIGRIHTVTIAGLPFLDAEGKVFFPKNISELLPKEVIKARRLARAVTPAELEIDGEDWNRLAKEDTGMRVHEGGGKKIVSKSEDFYDNQLMSFCSHQFQKASRIVSQTMNRYNIPTGDLYLGWRLRKMAEAGRLELQGDTNKALKDFEVKQPGDGTNAQYSLPL